MRRQETILLVEDEPMVLELVTMWLKKQGVVAGEVPFLPKPLSAEAVVAKVRQVLDSE